LPQSRSDGWLLDYSLDAALPDQIQADPTRLQQLLISAVELAILQADGDDLKLSVQPAQQPGQLLFSIRQINGQPGLPKSSWAQQLQQHLQRLCLQLNGKLLPIDESGTINCLIQS
jgi:hypothetical protein